MSIESGVWNHEAPGWLGGIVFFVKRALEVMFVGLGVSHV